MLQDFHSGGTVCSPTRATILTGRNHFRDCVDFVYGCSDMTECTPDFEFSAETFTIGDAVRAANKGHTSMFGGKVGAWVAMIIDDSVGLFADIVASCGSGTSAHFITTRRNLEGF